jgi:MYXO-CTERM domain-containing protein
VRTRRRPSTGATADSAAATDSAASSDGASSDGGGAGADAAESSAGYLDGGGLSCDVTSSGDDAAPLTGGVLGALALVAATRRRRSKRDRTTSVA